MHIKVTRPQPDSDPIKKNRVEEEAAFRAEEAQKARLVVVSRVSDKKDALTLLQALGLAP